VSNRLLACAALAFMAMAGGAQITDSAVAPRSVSGADSALEARTSAVAATLRCPVCQGESIQESPSGLAQQMRAVVRERLRTGESPDQVKAYFVSRYGEWILLEPKMTGLNILLYVLPVLLTAGGLVLVVFLVRRWTRSAESGDVPDAGGANP
jgi:cytochrome c-type biogenesis protein CcmH